MRSHPEVSVTESGPHGCTSSAGFDANKPSMMMFVTNKRVREQMSKVMAAFQAANIDLASAKVSD